MKKTFEKILNTIMCDVLGGAINSDACEVKDDELIFHCWDGKRFKLTRLPDGCEYDANTGLPISVGV